MKTYLQLVTICALHTISTSTVYPTTIITTTTKKIGEKKMLAMKSLAKFIKHLPIDTFQIGFIRYILNSRIIDRNRIIYYFHRDKRRTTMMSKMCMQMRHTSPITRRASKFTISPISVCSRCCLLLPVQVQTIRNEQPAKKKIATIITDCCEQ